MKLSIITVVYNGEKTIERAIRSVVEQNNVEIEYIIVDGGSSDHTLDIIEKYKEKIAKIVSEPDKGIYDAMNKGIRFSSGDVITFLNSDDWYENDTLQYVARAFDQESFDILCMDARMIYEYGNQIRHATLDGKAIIRQLPASHQAIFTTREWIEKIGFFNTDYIVSADFEWMTRSIIKGGRIKLLHKVVVNFSAGGFSTNYSKICYEEIKKAASKYYMGTSLEENVKKYYAYREYMLTGDEAEWEKGHFSENAFKISIPADKEIFIFGTGKSGMECCKLLEKLGYVISGFIDNYARGDKARYMGKTVRLPEDIQIGTSYIIIASARYENDMIEQIEKMGLCEKLDFDTYTVIQEQVIYGQ